LFLAVTCQLGGSGFPLRKALYVETPVRFRQPVPITHLRTNHGAEGDIMNESFNMAVAQRMSWAFFGLWWKLHK